MTRAADAEARRLRRPGRARPARGARRSAAGARRARRPVRCRARRSASRWRARAARRRVDVDARRGARARGRQVDARGRRCARDAGRPSSRCCSSCPGAEPSTERGTRVALRLARGERARARAAASGRERWGGYASATSSSARATASASFAEEAPLDRRAAVAASTRAPRRCARSSRPLETQVFAGNQVARDEGRGDRVRRPAAVRRRRPRAAYQLARERAPWRACG